MLKEVSLRTKIDLLLLLLLLLGILGGGLGLWRTIQNQAEAEFTMRGLILMAAMNGVRDYTSGTVGPLLSNEQLAQTGFIQEAIPAFAARQVFDHYGQNIGDASFVYKEATLNPTNPTDQADLFETGIIDQMRNDASLEQVSGFRTLPDERVYYIARPIAIRDASCLNCHGTPEAAPPELVAVYGSEAGFGWTLNEIVGTQIIYVPAEEVLREEYRSFLILMVTLVGTLVLAIVLTNYALHRLVIRPVTVMGDLAQKIAEDQMTPDDLEDRNLDKITTSSDELGSLARVFRKMAREIHERTKRLNAEVKKLHIEIDEIKRQKQVEAVFESAHLKDIVEKARAIRQQRAREKPAPEQPDPETD